MSRVSNHHHELAVAARPTILLGVYGNGLTYLLMMMAASARSSVIEIFYPEGFTHNYERTTPVLGMKHFEVWNNTSVRQLEHPCVAYRNGFQNTNIPVLAHALIGCGPCRQLYLSRLLPSLGSVLLSSSISHSHFCIQYLRSLHFNFSYHPASCSSTSACPVCVGSMP
jgi:hypothetical protein